MNIIINFLMELYNGHPANKFLMVLAVWLFWPGTMFLVGRILEGRTVPIWKHQSKLFFPGDLAFGIIVVAFIGIYAKIVQRTGTIMLSKAANTAWIWVAALAISFVVYFVLHNNEKDCYEARALCSPTKITHDIVGYVFIPWVLLSLLTITVNVTWRYCQFAQEKMPGSVLKNLGALAQMSWIYWVAIILAIALYVGCLIYDNAHPATPEDITARHPADWQPLWRR